MKHATIKNLKQNTKFEITLQKEQFFVEKLRISCSCYYSLFINGKIVDFGPERTAKGYTRIKEVEYFGDCKQLKFVLLHYGVPTYDFEIQDFFFGVEVVSNGKVAYDVSDFNAYKQTEYLNESCKYSFQRGLVERYDLTKEGILPLEFTPIESPIEIDSAGQTCDYNVLEFEKVGSGIFDGFAKVMPSWFDSIDFLKEVNILPLREQFLEFTTGNCFYDDYDLQENKTGLLKIEFFNATDGEKAYLLFDEYLPDGKWVFGRSSCNDFLEFTLKSGYNTIISTIPYTMQHIRLFKKSEKLDAKIQFICIQNDRARVDCKFSNKEINAVLNASLNTFKQNAFDVLTDCPGRERAGWLCDSYFSGFSEYFYTGRRTLERHFLENLILSDCPDVPKGMLPMCYPARHIDKNYIPNWAMWFIVELLRYYNESGDNQLIDKAKQKVYGICEFLKDYENEFCLLENLPAWVFIEWSKANDKEFIECVSIPSNILYVGMLESVAKLYDDDSALKKAEIIKSKIIELAFDGKYFCDNAIRIDGVLTAQRNHVSETCQYYALFFNIVAEPSYKADMIKNFAMNKAENPNGIPKSNVFIGNFLRMFFLLREGEYQRIIDETVPYFYNMAKRTGTLWEKDTPDASCNHGLNGCLAVVLSKCAEKLGL